MSNGNETDKQASKTDEDDDDGGNGYGYKENGRRMSLVCKVPRI